MLDMWTPRRIILKVACFLLEMRLVTGSQWLVTPFRLKELGWSYEGYHHRSQYLHPGKIGCDS